MPLNLKFIFLKFLCTLHISITGKANQNNVSAMGLLGQLHRHAGGVNHQARHNSWPWRCRTTSVVWSHTKDRLQADLVDYYDNMVSSRRTVVLHVSSSGSCSMAREWRVEHMHGGSQHGKQWQAKADTYIHILLVMTNYICMNIWCLLILITSNWSTSPHA